MKIERRKVTVTDQQARELGETLKSLLIRGAMSHAQGLALSSNSKDPSPSGEPIFEIYKYGTHPSLGMNYDKKSDTNQTI